ncbi:hypothetical protein [Chelativorans xinjiangense]|uniref:hypothetical protein n=1 Tax=Chelativorans xinjiangense TaxID=2681485 RepID=UPI0013581EB9|nr:hypothetical protein [Chelativorans xinjiangense]
MAISIICSRRARAYDEEARGQNHVQASDHAAARLTSRRFGVKPGAETEIARLMRPHLSAHLIASLLDAAGNSGAGFRFTETTAKTTAKTV